jgi:hypothetical protein
MADLADELLEHQYRESLSITTNREPHMTDQPNVEPPSAPTPGIGITLAEAKRHLGGPVEYHAAGQDHSYIERGIIYRVDVRAQARQDAVFVKFGLMPTLTPLDRLRILPWPKGEPESEPRHVSIEDIPAIADAMAAEAVGPDESYLSGLAKALRDAAEDPHSDHCGEYSGLTEGDAEFLARVARDWMHSQAKPAPEAPMPQYAPAPFYPPQWPGQWEGGYQQGAPPPAVPAEVPDLIEQREWLTDALPRAAGERVIYRGRPTDPPLLALVVSVQQSPSGVAAVAQYTVRVPYLGQTLGAFADQLASWHEPEPDF